MTDPTKPWPWCEFPYERIKFSDKDAEYLESMSPREVMKVLNGETYLRPWYVYLYRWIPLIRYRK